MPATLHPHARFLSFLRCGRVRCGAPCTEQHDSEPSGDALHAARPPPDPNDQTLAVCSISASIRHVYSRSTRPEATQKERTRPMDQARRQPPNTKIPTTRRHSHGRALPHGHHDGGAPDQIPSPRPLGSWSGLLQRIRWPLGHRMATATSPSARLATRPPPPQTMRV